MPKVSVIVPIYNVEQYIERCARSLFEQTLEDIEFIFVNDCTPDNSMAMLTKIISDYPARTAQIKIVNHDVNKGLPTARRSGLTIATGEYVIHCDSDDWVEPQMYEEMYNDAARDNADGILCDYFLNMGDDEIIKSSKSSYLNSTNIHHNCLKDILSAQGMQSLWRYLFKKDIYQKVEQFPAKNQGEDISTLLQLVYFSNTIEYIPHAYYHWRYNINSITHKQTYDSQFKRLSDSIENTDLMLRFAENHHLDRKYNSEIVALKYNCRFMLSDLVNKGYCVDKWFSIYPEINHKILLNKHIHISQKRHFIITFFRKSELINRLYITARNALKFK